MTQQDKIDFLRSYGYVVGDRDFRLNTNYPGKFMVSESYEECELPTEDGSNGPWCVTGDDLDILIDTGYDCLSSLVDPVFLVRKTEIGMETSNQVLQRVLTNLETLVSWAAADAEHSDESDAPGQAADDRVRGQIYRQAIAELTTAFKS